MSQSPRENWDLFLAFGAGKTASRQSFSDFHKSGEINFTNDDHGENSLDENYHFILLNEHSKFSPGYFDLAVCLPVNYHPPLISCPKFSSPNV